MKSTYNCGNIRLYGKWRYDAGIMNLLFNPSICQELVK